MIDFIILGVILVLVALAGGYVYRAKKNGKKCIGCPGCSGGSCSCGGKKPK